jgi:hypothetical protein
VLTVSTASGDLAKIASLGSVPGSRIPRCAVSAWHQHPAVSTGRNAYSPSKNLVLKARTFSGLNSPLT